jgi:hypothetical protein
LPRPDEDRTPEGARAEGVIAEQRQEVPPRDRTREQHPGLRDRSVQAMEADQMQDVRWYELIGRGYDLTEEQAEPVDREARAAIAAGLEPYRPMPQVLADIHPTRCPAPGILPPELDPGMPLTQDDDRHRRGEAARGNAGP